MTISAADLRRWLQPHRPPLLLGAGGFDALRGRVAASPLLQRWFGWIRERAEELLDVPIISDTEVKPTSPSRMLMERVQVLSLTYRLAGDDRCLAAAVRELRGAAADGVIWYRRGDRFVLDTAEAATACALGLEWLGEALDPAVRAEVRAALVERALHATLREYADPAGNRWPTRNNNWNQVCNGGAIIAALVMAEEEPDLSAAVLERTLNSLPLAMAEFAPHGAWEEGPIYWRYGTLWNCLALAALETVLGATFGLEEHQGFKETADFYIHSFGPTGKSFNFSDSSAALLPSPQMLWMARQFDRPEVALAERRIIERLAVGDLSPTGTTHEHGVEGKPVHPLDIVWWDPAWEELPEFSWPTDACFGKSEVALVRGDWQSPHAVFVGFKGGTGRRAHSHLDMGSFVLDALGHRWACDLGSESYGIPGYFEAWDGSSYRHFSFYRTRPEGHNTLVINPHIQPQQDIDAHAPITRTRFTADRAFAICDLSPLYARQAERVERGIALTDGRTRVLLQDEARSRKAVDFWWFMHTQAEITIHDEGRTAVLTLGEMRLCAQLLVGSAGAFQMLPCAPMVHSPNPPGQHDNAGYRKLAIHCEVAVNPTVAVRFTPLPPGAPLPEIAGSALVPLAEWR